MNKIIRFFFIFWIRCIFWTLDTLLRSFKFTKVLINDPKTKYHIGWSQRFTLQIHILTLARKYNLPNQENVSPCFSVHLNPRCPSPGPKENSDQIFIYALLKYLKTFFKVWKGSGEKIWFHFSLCRNIFWDMDLHETF